MAVTLNANTSTGFIATSDTSGVLQLQTGGTTAVTVDASQNVGIGVTPSAWNTAWKGLQVVNSSLTNNGFNDVYLGANFVFDSTSTSKYIVNDFATLYGQVNGQHQWFNAASGTAGNTVSFTTAMTLDASGKLLVGTTASSDARLYVRGAGTTSATASFEASNSAGATRFYVQDDGTTRFFGSAGSETARINSDGRFLIGKTTTSTANQGIVFNSNANCIFTVTDTGAADTLNVWNDTAGAYRFYVTRGGTIFATSTTISAISDIRFKENVRDLNVGLAEVMALKPRLYDWKEGKGQDIKNARGFIAQEFEEVFPDLIDEWKDPAPEGEEPYKSVRADLIPTLVKAIQEQQAIIQTLTDRITALEGTTP